MEENGEYGTIQNSEKKSLQGGLTKISFEKTRGKIMADLYQKVRESNSGCC